MSVRQTLAAANIVNSWDLLRRFGVKGKDVAVDYSPHSRATSGGAKVWSPSFKTNPKGGHWADRDNKWFGGYKAESMAEAIAWATEKYGITEWVACPTDAGVKIPKYAREAALAFVKQQRKAA